MDVSSWFIFFVCAEFHIAAKRRKEREKARKYEMLCVDTMRHQRAGTQAVTTNSRFTSQHASKLKMECTLDASRENPVYFCIRINSTKGGERKIERK